MESVLFGDPFSNHIATYLNPTNLYNLCKTCKYYRFILTKPYFKKSTIAVIKKRLLHLYNTPEKVNHFLTVLFKDGVINGKFIIQCILGRYEYDPIWCYYPETFKFNQELAQFRKPHNSGQIIDYAEGSIFFTPVIKFAIMRHNNIHRYIDSTCYFPFEINKYWYTDKDHLHVHSFNEILSKKITYDKKIFSNLPKSMSEEAYLSCLRLTMAEYNQMGFSFRQIN